MTTEGNILFAIPGTDRPCYTYYKLVGSLDSPQPPMVLVHGGPGVGHEYLLSYTDLWTKYGIPLIFYDQIGCAASTRLPEKAGDVAFWTMDLFLAELQNVVAYFGLADKPQGYDVFGQSWGGRVAPMYAGQQPRGLRRLVLASGLADAESRHKGYQLWKDTLEPQDRDAIDRAVENGNYDTPEYQKAMMAFMMKTGYRSRPPLPAELMLAMKHAKETDIPTVILGPSLFAKGGNLTDWTTLPVLPKISACTLVLHGEYDGSHPIAQEPFKRLIPDVRTKVIAGAGHFCHLEPDHRDEVMKAVGEFLTAP